MPTAPLIPAERFATLIAWLTRSVAAMSGGDRLSYWLIGQIAGRLRFINQRFRRLAARVRDGRYRFRTVTPHHRKATPRRADPLPKKFGWLLPLVPEAVVFRSQLEFLLRDPGMVDLIEAAPASLGRPLRSLCWMLRLSPPEILARPAKPRPPPKAARPAAPKPAPAPRPHAPAWPRAPGSRRWSLARKSGPPFPA
jgi:hypothetical protein